VSDASLTMPAIVVYIYINESMTKGKSDEPIQGLDIFKNI
jgi:hypothetical protein